MVRKFVSATVSAALCLMSVAPGAAVAQEYRFTGFDAPRGTSATLNLRVPFGNAQAQRQRLTYGLALRQGQVFATPNMDGQTMTRAINLADLRFTGDEVRQARIAGFDLANLEEEQRRMNLTGEGNTLWIVVGLVAAGVAICLLADCFDGDVSDSSD